MDKTKHLETVLVIVLAMMMVYWFKRYNALLLCAILTGLAAVLVPAVAGAIHWFWAKLSDILGSVSGRILLTVTYVLVLLPLSFLAKRFGKTTIRTKAGGNSYFKERNHTYRKEDMSNPW